MVCFPLLGFPFTTVLLLSPALPQLAHRLAADALSDEANIDVLLLLPCPHLCDNVLAVEDLVVHG
jgi:hypothetical protein